MKIHTDSAYDYRDRPVPVIDNPTTTRDYRHIPVNLASQEAQEHLIDIASLGIAAESYYARTDGFNPPYYQSFVSAPTRVYCRQKVASKLAKVNNYLERYGVELLVWDGYRPITCQEDLWRYFIARARQEGTHRSEEDIVNYVSGYCSDPRGFDPEEPTTWPTHITGGAVDLTLRRISCGELLFMGGIFDDPSEVSHTSYFETLDTHNLTASALEARRNRRLLYWSMVSADFANYPFEWWHFDWGTQMWALNRRSGQGQTLAVYGPARLESPLGL